MEIFGHLPNGDPVHKINLNHGGLTASVITYGASLQDLRLAGHTPSLILGFPEFEPYLKHPYFGAIVGRVANRIANGKFELNGNQYQLPVNNNGHALHGGPNGLGRRNWKIKDHLASSVTLTIDDTQDTSHYPANCAIECTYRLTPDAGLSLVITATADAVTVCNLAHHSYFNLDGKSDILDHQLQLDADYYLPVDHQLIPTGAIQTVDDSPFDFRDSRPIKQGDQKAYDHNFCLGKTKQPMRKIGELTSLASQIRMAIETTEMGVQMYSGEFISVDFQSHNTGSLGKFSGIALEPQSWPDAPNHSNFPSILLKKGETYRQETCFKFTKANQQ
jgi:aldose 1-epimerase